jgi:ribosomal protein L11
MFFEKQQIHVMPDESKKFSVNTPPFSNFLVEKVFAKMQEKDKELVRLGQLSPDKMFSYNIVREGELIREIIIKNVDEERLKELKSSVRWTLEKMFEKMKQGA